MTSNKKKHLPPPSGVNKKIRAFIVALSTNGLKQLVNALDYGKVEILGVVLQSTQGVKVRIQERDIDVFSFSSLRDILERYGNTAYYLLCGIMTHPRDLGAMASMMRRVNPDVIKDHILNMNLDFSPSWMGNLHYASTEKIDFFATGISYTELGLDIRQFPERGVNLGYDSQDLYNGYRIAEYVFSHQHNPVRFVLIGLCPYSFHYALRDQFSVLGQRYPYDFIFQPEDRSLDHMILKEELRKIFWSEYASHPDPNNDRVRGIQAFLLNNGCGILDFKRELEDVSVHYHAGNLKKNKNILLKYIRLCRQHGAVPIGVVFPFSICLREAYPARDLSEFRSILEDYHSMLGFDVIDLFDKKLDETHFQNLSHVNSKGAAYLSRMISKKVTEILSADSSASS